MRAACAELAELRSAFVDGALNAADYDRVSAHLAGCAACRSDVQDLRTVHELVRGNPGPDHTPTAELARRLAAIPGSETTAAGLARGSRRSGAWSGRLRADRRRVVLTTMAGVATLTVVGVTGYLAAPLQLAAVPDPSAVAEAEFSSALDQLPLSGDARDAVAWSNPTVLASSQGSVADVGPGMTTGDLVSEATALADLRRAATAAETVSYTAQQSFVAYGTDQTYTAQLQVVSQPGQASQINVVSQNGRPLVSDFSRVAGSSRLADDQVLSLLERNYDLSGVRGSVVVGRPATMLQATRAGTLAGRWWVDDETGLILWQQRFDTRGRLQLSTGFTALEPGEHSDVVPHLPPRAVLPVTTVALTLANATPLAAAGWACAPDVAGLSLIKLRVDRTEDPQSVHLVYTDGFTTVGVSEQRGRLAGAPAQSGWDAGLRAYVRPGATNLASWESGDRVFTLMTDGSPELLARAVASLPHEPALERTTMGRVQAGWREILAPVRG